MTLTMNDYLLICLSFGLMNFIYVMLNTISSIFCIKAGLWLSAISSAICYGFYTIVLKQIVGVPTEVAFWGTVITNIVGRIGGTLISERFIKKDYKVTICDNNSQIALEQYLDMNNFSYHWVYAENNEKQFKKYSIYEISYKDGKMLKYVLNKEIKCKWHTE